MNKIIPCLYGKEYYIMGGKSTAYPKLSIYLLATMDKKPEYSLWYGEFVDEEGKIDFWPYDGEDSEDLKMELMENFIEHAFDAD